MSNLPLLQAGLLLVTGLVAGILNVLAGGGSLLTLPMLIFLGLPATTANGTNRIAILVQNVFAVSGFRRLGVFPLRPALLCLPPALIGSYVGAGLAVRIDETLFKRLLACVMLGVLLLTVWDPMQRLRRSQPHLSGMRLAGLLLSFFVVGVYGGFVQAGVGFLIISALLCQGFDLVRTNAIKVIVIGGFTLVALAVFIRHGQVHYGMGLALATGNACGGWLGSRLAVKKGHDWIKKVVSLTVLAFAVKLLLD